MEMHEPYTFLNGLTVADMEDLLEDIQVRPAVCPTTTTSRPQACPHTSRAPSSRSTWNSSRARTQTSGGT